MGELQDLKEVGDLVDLIVEKEQVEENTWLRKMGIVQNAALRRPKVFPDDALAYVVTMKLAMQKPRRRCYAVRSRT